MRRARLLPSPGAVVLAWLCFSTLAAAQPSDTAPSRPDGLTGTVIPGDADDVFLLRWQASTDDHGVRGYSVYINDNRVAATSTPDIRLVLPAGSRNEFRVAAFDTAATLSPRSDTITLARSTSDDPSSEGATTPSTESDALQPTNPVTDDAGSAADADNEAAPAGTADNTPAPSSNERAPGAPFFVNLEDQVIVAGPVWEYRITPADDDGSVPGLTIGTLPVGMSERDNRDGTRSLRWQPLQPDVGNYTITLTAHDAADASLTTVETLNLRVELPDDLSIIPNRPPTIDAIGDFVVRAGDPIVLRVKAVDANGTVPDLTVLNSPPGASFVPLEEDPRIRELRFVSDPSTIGPVQYDFRANDADDPSLTFFGSATLDFRAPGDFVRSGSRLRDLADQAGIHFGYAALLNNHARADGALYRDIAAAEFNLVTPENSMKWGFANPERGVYRLEDADRVVAFARQNNMQVHGHTLVWYAQLPQWVQQSALGEREALMNDFIDMMTRRYPDVLLWDVVNEVFEDDGSFRKSVWYDAMGEAHVDKAFRRARQNDPDAILIYNDYDVAAGGDKTDAMYAMLSRLVAEGVPVDGVGFQMHIDTQFTDFDAVAETFQRFADLGLDIYITELDVNRVPGDSEADQAAVFANSVRACLAQTACRAVQIWGFTDRYTWRAPNTPLIMDRDYQPKAAYPALQRALSGQ